MNSRRSARRPAGEAGEREAVQPVARFEICRRRYIAADGTAVCDLPAWAEDAATLRGLYRQMVLTRRFDEKAIALQRTGRLGTYASSLGQEAVGVGVASVMAPDDILVPSYREHAAQLTRGVTIEELLLYWGGDERGSRFAGPKGDFPVCIPVASQFPHAAGAALAIKLQGRKAVAVAMGGDGATSKGDFYEALNFAGIWQLPAVFVVSNNGWAISVPRGAQTRAETLAQKAIAAGIAAEQVDGNDIVAVREAAAEALARARQGEGPSLIEALTYRLGDHTTVDDARRYRDDAEVSARWKEEPVARLRAFMTAKTWWTKDDEQALLANCGEEVNRAAETYLAMPPESPPAMMEHLFAQLPPALAAQRDELAGAGGPGDA
jgi:pyruvate dehydrogenase E1 component alpha subunit